MRIQDKPKKTVKMKIEIRWEGKRRATYVRYKLSSQAVHVLLLHGISRKDILMARATDCRTAVHLTIPGNVNGKMPRANGRYFFKGELTEHVLGERM